MTDLINARELKGGDWFRKRTGSHRHLVLSESAARFHKLPEGKVYGISFETGNMTAVDPDTMVVRLESLALMPEHSFEAGDVICRGGDTCRTCASRARKNDPHPSPPAPGRAIMLTCGSCALCLENGDSGDCLRTGEPTSVLADEGLDYRF